MEFQRHTYHKALHLQYKRQHKVVHLQYKRYPRQLYKSILHSTCATHRGKHLCLIPTSPNLLDKISNTPNITHDTNRAILNFSAFSSAILHATLTLLALRFATRSLSIAASSMAWASFNSSVATSTSDSNRLNFAITIGVVAMLRLQVLLSSHLKNLQLCSSSCTLKQST